jgi:predicted RNase H-like HicB family nuclease
LFGIPDFSETAVLECLDGKVFWVLPYWSARWAMKLRIKILVNDSGDYVASCPALPGCTCRGRSVDEARLKINEAICGYVAAVGNFVPENITPEVIEA